MSHIIDFPDRLEEYLAGGGSDTPILPVLDTLLNKYVGYLGMKSMPPSTTAMSLNYLQKVLMSSMDADSVIIQSVREGLTYILPYLFFRRSNYSTDAMTMAVDALIRAGVSVNTLMEESLGSSQKIVDLLVSRGYLDTATPTLAHYRRESNWPSYKSTGRPMTYMSEMCKRVGTSLSTSDQKMNALHLYLPVLRYQSLYYAESGKGNFCGTFYYIDAESPVLLDLGKTAVFGSKVHALLTLGAALQCIDVKRQERLRASRLFPFDESHEISRLMSTIHGWDIVWKEINKEKGTTVESMRFLINNLIKPYYFPILQNETDVTIIPDLGTTVLYPTDKAKYWSSDSFHAGMHDKLDQRICLLARELGIDTVILQHEVGEYRVVSEILDTRTNTYSHLFRVKDAKSWYTPSEKYPAVWFTDNGFVTSGGITHDFKIDTSDLNVVKI